MLIHDTIRRVFPNIILREGSAAPFFRNLHTLARNQSPSLSLFLFRV